MCDYTFQDKSRVKNTSLDDYNWYKETTRLQKKLNRLFFLMQHNFCALKTLLST